jgi:hypothetical protein
MNLAVVSAVDGFAMAMVVILTLGLGVVALLLWSITRHGKRRDREVEDLIEEVRRDQDARKLPTPTAPPEAREPWEKDGDWWKK